MLKKFLEKFKSSLRFQIIGLTLVSWGVAMAIERKLVERYRVRADDIYAIKPGYTELVRNSGDKVALLLLSLFETLLFGLGIGFFVAVGARVFRIKNNILKRRMVYCWACISFFLVEWWPHSTSHSLVAVSSGDPEDNYIAIEICFHWTIMICSISLSYFQYDLIMMMFEVAMLKMNMEDKKEIPVVKDTVWYKNLRVHALVIMCVFFAVGMIICFMIEPLNSDYKKYQNFFMVIFKMVDSFVLALGMGFLYVSLRVIKKLSHGVNIVSTSFRKVLVISTFCIWFLCTIQYAHPMVHNHTPTAMKSTISIDFGVHIPIVIATAVLGYYQFRLLELATDSSSAVSMSIAMRMKKINTMKQMKKRNGADLPGSVKSGGGESSGLATACTNDEHRIETIIRDDEEVREDENELEKTIEDISFSLIESFNEEE